MGYGGLVTLIHATAKVIPPYFVSGFGVSLFDLVVRRYSYLQHLRMILVCFCAEKVFIEQIAHPGSVRGFENTAVSRLDMSLPSGPSQ